MYVKKAKDDSSFMRFKYVAAATGLAVSMGLAPVWAGERAAEGSHLRQHVLGDGSWTKEVGQSGKSKEADGCPNRPGC